MQNIKLMFRSPRFIVGFTLVFIILAYAIFVPIVFTADPKESRAPSPYYDRAIEFNEVLLSEDDAAIAEGIARLRADAAAETDPLLVDAAQNLVDTMDIIEETLASTPSTRSILALDQVKSARKYPLINAERETMRAYLEAEDYDAAKAEGAKLLAHCAEANAFVDALSNQVVDFDAARATLEAFIAENEFEVAEIAAAIDAKDIEALNIAMAAFTANNDAPEVAKFIENLGDAYSLEIVDFDTAKLAVEAFATKTEVEVADIVAAIDKQDAAALNKAVEEFSAQHTAFEGYVNSSIERIDENFYVTAAEAARTKVQKTYLIPKDSPPSSRFWFGTDTFSRDLFLEMAYGARTSLLVGLIGGVLATIIGLSLGLTAGYVGGWVDNVITVFTNTFIVIPGFVILVLISIAIGQFREAWITGLIIGCIAWPWTARAVRAQTTSLRYRDHVNMARITGYSTAHIILTEIVPYIMSYVVMAFILQVAGGIMQESTLALLGLGDPTGISLGRLMNWAREYEAINYNRWWQFIPVACAIAMITFGLYLMNSGMDQVFNPKIRS